MYVFHDVDPIEFVCQGTVAFTDLVEPNRWGSWGCYISPDDDTVTEQLQALADEWNVEPNWISDFGDLKLRAKQPPRLYAAFGVMQHETQFARWGSTARVRFYAEPNPAYHGSKCYLNLSLSDFALIANCPYSLAREEERRLEWWRFMKDEECE